MTEPHHHLKLQAGRVLEQLRSLDQQYGLDIASEDPELAEALAASVTALERFIGGTPRRETCAV